MAPLMMTINNERFGVNTARPFSAFRSASGAQRDVAEVGGLVSDLRELTMSIYSTQRLR